MEALVFLLVMLALAGGLIVSVIIAWRAQQVVWGKPVGTEGWINRAAHRWGAMSLRQKAWLENWDASVAAWKETNKGASKPAKPAKQSWFDRQQQKLDEKRRGDALMARIRAEVEANEAKGVEGRLEEQFEQLQAGTISLEEYRASILDEQSDAKAALEALRADRRHMDRDDYEDEKERAEDDIEATRWRLRWVNEQIRDAKSRPEGIAKSGKWARFEYAGDDGVVRRWNIANWRARDGVVIGWDRKAREEVEFSFDGISGWIAE